jgi:hypothetical protein
MQTPTLPLYPSEKNPSLIKRLQTQLKAVGYTKIFIDGIFGRDTLTAVRAFQATTLDADNRPLYIDGIVGEKTWNTLFAGDRKPSPHPSPFQQHALHFAIQQLGVQENPIGSNRGDQIDKYLKSVKAPAGVPWCAAFIYWCFQQASYEICTINPLIKTAHCLTHWNRTQGQRIFARASLQLVPLTNIKPGAIFIIQYKNGMGHCGIIKEIHGDKIITIEGNTNLNHSREGYGVFQHTRKISDINTGFINYG